MENVILSENQRWHAIWDDAPKTPVKRSKWLHMSQNQHDELIAKAQAKHLLRILKEPCDPRGHCGVSVYLHKINCPECMAEIEKEIEN